LWKIFPALKVLTRFAEPAKCRRFSGVARDAQDLADGVQAKAQFDPKPANYSLDEWALGS
jgi:hypothetical protein